MPTAPATAGLFTSTLSLAGIDLWGEVCWKGNRNKWGFCLWDDTAQLSGTTGCVLPWQGQQEMLLNTDPEPVAGRSEMPVWHKGSGENVWHFTEIPGAGTKTMLIVENWFIQHKATQGVWVSGVWEQKTQKNSEISFLNLLCSPMNLIFMPSGTKLCFPLITVPSPLVGKPHREEQYLCRRTVHLLKLPSAHGGRTRAA